MAVKLTDGVIDLLTHRINTFEKLEIVVALRRADRHTSSVDQLARAIGSDGHVVREAALELRAASLVVVNKSGDVQLLPPASRDHAAIEALARAYDEEKLAVVKLMGEIAMGRLRNMTARMFSDAFVFRKKPPGDNSDG